MDNSKISLDDFSLDAFYDADHNRILTDPFVEEGYSKEETYDFLVRMKLAKDVEWDDLYRMERELPIFKQLSNLRVNLVQCFERIASGKMSVQSACDETGVGTKQKLERFIKGIQCVECIYTLAKTDGVNRKESRAEKALIERSIEGVDEPLVNNMGQICGTKKKYSDTLLAMHLKTIAPAKYSKPDGNIQKGIVVSVNLGLRSPEQVIQPRQDVSTEMYKQLESGDGQDDDLDDKLGGTVSFDIS